MKTAHAFPPSRGLSRVRMTPNSLGICTDAAEHDALEADKAVILAEIGTYVGYLNGYED